MRLVVPEYAPKTEPEAKAVFVVFTWMPDSDPTETAKVVVPVAANCALASVLKAALHNNIKIVIRFMVDPLELFNDPKWR